MHEEKITQMRKARKVRCEFPFEIKKLYRGYADRILRIDVDKDEISIHPVTQQMKDLWTGGKGFDLWLMFQEITKDTKWDSPENPICFSPGPLGGTTSFPGSGKTLVTSLSPLTSSAIDCNVGGYFGPYMKFAGFDVILITGKAKTETIIYIDAVNKKITIESAPKESIDSHLIAEELTEMYADDDLDKRNIAVVSAGRGADFVRMGVLNFSFWDWRRNVARLKQAGRGGVGTVFRNKMLKALVIKNRDITPAWRVEENKVAKWVKPKKITTLCPADIEFVDSVIEKWGNDPQFVVEIMQDIQDRFNYISVSAMDRITVKTGTPKAYIYHIATFDPFFSLEPKSPAAVKTAEPVKVLFKEQPVVFNENGTGDYKTFKKILGVKKPEEIILEIKNSRLRSRACGSLVGDNWEKAFNTAKEKSLPVSVICGGVDAEPETAIGRTIFETNPNSVIEGMLIGAYAVGAAEGFVVIRKEYALAEEKLQNAIDEAKKKNLLGEKILGSDFSFDISIHRSGGAFVPGEPSSLINAMSGRAGDSRAKYIPLVEAGFRGNPTVLFNAETSVNIPAIIEKGAQWFASIGTKSSPGTKVFHLSGTRNTGLVEVPMGTNLKKIIEEIGGGSSKGNKIKAVQIGGYAGEFIPANLMDMKLDLDSLDKVKGLGSGRIEVMDETTCMTCKLQGIVEFLADESCGKCTPCREGLFAIKNTLARIDKGEGKEGDIVLLEDIAKTMNETSLCNFGVSASVPVLSSLQYFKQDFADHIAGKECGCSKCQSNG
jgi:NADH:ubiquinone oxidoreductase subunit F (NADH-binding)